jgi:ectoine hydroxylase-related dioxygenase (phytanoyl-CoA dioxygenase family)
VTNSTAADRIVSRDLLDFYNASGFVMVPDLLTPEEVERFGAAVTAAVHHRTRHNHVPLEQRSNYQQSFLQCMNLWEDRPDVAPLTFHPKVAQAAAELMGVDACRVWHDQALIKEAHGRVTDAHQDHPYWPIKETNSITAWIPFVQSTLENGALGYVPGSHAVGLRKFVNIFFGEPQDILSEPEIADVEPVFLSVPPGSVAFHHGLTVHLAGANTTDTNRSVHTIIFFPDGSTRGYPYPHFSVDRGGIEVGQRIDSDATPIAWPRPPDQAIPPLPATASRSMSGSQTPVRSPNAISAGSVAPSPRPVGPAGRPARPAAPLRR